MQKYHVQLLTSTYQSLQLQNDILLRLVKHIIMQFFSNNLGNNSLKKILLEGKTILRHKFILNLFNQLISTNCKGRWFFTIKRIKSFKNCFCYTSFFLKGYFATKQLDMELEETFDVFLEGCLSSSFEGQLISFSIFLKMLE